MERFKKLIREVPDFPEKGILFYDITTLLKDPVGFQEVLNALYEKVKDRKIDKVAAIESRGFIFGSYLAAKLNAGLVLIRKPGKLPADKISESYSLEYGKNTIEIHEDGVTKGDSVLLMDDLLATGGTLNAGVNLIERLGGHVDTILILIELEFLKGREKLKEGLRVETLLTY